MSPEDKKKLGGSDVGAVLGLSRYAGPLSVYGRVVEGIEREETSFTNRGKVLESAVLDWYAAETGNDLQRDCRLIGLAEHERATLDAAGYDHRDDVPLVTTVEGKTANWRVMGEWGEPGTDAIPQEYVLQSLWYQGCARLDPRFDGVVFAPHGHVPALVGGDFGLWVVPWDEELFGIIRQGMERFWVEHVLAKKRPDPQGVGADGEYICKRWATHRTPALPYWNLSTEQVVLLDAYERSLDSKREAVAAHERIADKVRLMLGDAGGVDGMPGGRRLTFQQNKPTAVTDWEAVARDMVKSEKWDKATDEHHAIARKHTTQHPGARPLVLRQGAKR